MKCTKRYFLEIAYNGTAYHGWQSQPNAISVQEKLNAALLLILGKKIETLGAGRTDTGVHARQLFVHFDSDNKLLHGNPDRFIHSLNAVLPLDISARRLLAVHDDAHARFDATERSYEYHIHFRKDPFLHNRSWQLRDSLDIVKMNDAAKFLIGKQDFGCFSKSNTQVFTNVCTIKEAIWIHDGSQIVFRITADRFLRNMVRAIVGTLFEIGGKDKPTDFIREVLASKDRSLAGSSVPAHGLYLTKVKYPYID